MLRITCHLLIVLICAISLSACGEAENSDPETENLQKVEEPTAPESGNKAPATPDKFLGEERVMDDGSVKKTMHMVFLGYEEGDYPHLLFRDVSTGEEYDFQYLNENRLRGANVLLEDPNSAFGYRANAQLLNQTFVVKATQKMVASSDLNGQLIQVKGWVIDGLEPKR